MNQASSGERPQVIDFKNGEKVKPTFSAQEMSARVSKLRDHMAKEKIDAVLGLDHRFAETTQGQRYEVGQQFKHHYDYFFESESYWQTERRRGGQRTWTAMVFLNEPAGGGETEFPQLSFKMLPRTGMLLIWNNMGLDGRPNPYLLHSGNPVTQGTKYIVTKWFRRGFWV